MFCVTFVTKQALFSSELYFMISNFISKNRGALIGISLGAVAGFMYYYFIGCANGSCLISSNPFISTPYGALMGFLAAGIFKKKEHANS